MLYTQGSVIKAVTLHRLHIRKQRAVLKEYLLAHKGRSQIFIANNILLQGHSWEALSIAEACLRPSGTVHEGNLQRSIIAFIVIISGAGVNLCGRLTCIGTWAGMFICSLTNLASVDRLC